MENGPFEDVFPIEEWGYSIAMLVYQRVNELLRLRPLTPPSSVV